MKKTLLIFALLMANITTAQEVLKNESKDSAKKISFSIITGINFNHFNRPGTDYGFKIGGGIIFNTYKFYNFSSGLSYSQLGGQAIDKEVLSIQGSEITQRDFLNRSIKMHSIEIPALMHFKHPKSLKNNAQPELYLGLVYNAILYVNEKRDELWHTTATTPVGDVVKSLINNQNENVTSSYKTHLFSTVIGTNIYFKLSEKNKYFFGFEYKIGLQNIKNTPYPYGGNMKTSQFNIKLGVIL